MHIVVAKDTSVQNLKKAIESMKKGAAISNGINIHNFKGKVRWNEDALTFQKRIRDEWI